MQFSRLIPILASLLFAVSPGQARADESAVVDLVQKPQVLARHQREVGNVRALARRQGVVEAVPQVFAYSADLSPAFHLRGYRQDFTGDLDTALRRFRRLRDMVDLEALLKNADSADGESVDVGSLETADVYLVIYRADDCAVCDRVESELETWMARHPSLAVARIRVDVNLRR